MSRICFISLRNGRRPPPRGWPRTCVDPRLRSSSGDKKRTVALSASFPSRGCDGLPLAAADETAARHAARSLRRPAEPPLSHTRGPQDRSLLPSPTDGRKGGLPDQEGSGVCDSQPTTRGRHHSTARHTLATTLKTPPPSRSRRVLPSADLGQPLGVLLANAIRFVPEVSIVDLARGRGRLSLLPSGKAIITDSRPRPLQCPGSPWGARSPRPRPLCLDLGPCTRVIRGLSGQRDAAPHLPPGRGRRPPRSYGTGH